MTIALVVLALGGNAVAAFIAYLSHIERRVLIAAMLQAQGLPDAARRMAPVTKEKAKEAVDLQRELIESGGVFSASNPFGTKKPEGI